MVSITGAKQFELLGLRLKAAGEAGLRNRLRAELKGITVPLVEDVKQAAQDQLPRKGGLNQWVADGKFKTSVIFTGGSTGVRILAVAKSSKKSGTTDFGTDRGVVRHPVFGHGDRWVGQKLASAGWFSKTLEQRAPEVAVPAIRAALEATAAAITRG